MRRAARRDANEREIVDALRRAGCLVQPITQGAGVPDLLVCCRGRLVLLEVKDGAKPLSAQRLTPAEATWIATWQHAGATVHVVTSAADALICVGATRGA